MTVSGLVGELSEHVPRGREQTVGEIMAQYRNLGVECLFVAWGVLIGLLLDPATAVFRSVSLGWRITRHVPLVPRHPQRSYIAQWRRARQVGKQRPERRRQERDAAGSQSYEDVLLEVPSRLSRGGVRGPTGRRPGRRG